jgi:hypothetical protein
VLAHETPHRRGAFDTTKEIVLLRGHGEIPDDQRLL